jgi:hypothetical protein
MQNAGALHTMTTLKIVPRFSLPETHDFVVSDTAELASHMDHCASSRSRFFALQTAVDSAHSALSARIVTVAVFLTFVVASLALA